VRIEGSVRYGLVWLINGFVCKNDKAIELGLTLRNKAYGYLKCSEYSKCWNKEHNCLKIAYDKVP